jgi:hypothetical protein
MAYDEGLATRIRAVAPNHDLREQKMFGGLAFLTGGHMGAGVMGDRLLIRVPPDQYERTLAEPHVTPMDFAGRQMRGFVCVEPAGIAEEGELKRWVGRGLAFASSLPPK